MNIAPRTVDTIILLEKQRDEANAYGDAEHARAERLLAGYRRILEVSDAGGSDAEVAGAARAIAATVIAFFQ